MGSGRKRKITIHDIAAAVGTSSATVSRVLSSSSYPVREEVRLRVLDTASKLDYSPDKGGKFPRRGRGAKIGVIVPTISNPFYSQIVHGIELEARKKGYYLFLCNSLRDPEAERRYLELLCQKQVKGIIISTISDNHSYLRELQQSGIRIVAIDQDIPDVKCSKVGFDHSKGAFIATEYLIGMKHRNIAFASAPLTRRTRKEAVEGYKLALLKSNVPFREENILIAESEEEPETGYYEFENGKRLAEKFLKMEDRPTAIFAVNDMTAIGIIQGLLTRGVKVPDDVSVVGFDDIEISSMVNPPLTTVAHPSYETGRLACRILLDNMNDSEGVECTVMVEPSLIKRYSVRDCFLSPDDRRYDYGLTN